MIYQVINNDTESSVTDPNVKYVKQVRTLDLGTRKIRIFSLHDHRFSDGSPIKRNSQNDNAKPLVKLQKLDLFGG